MEKAHYGRFAAMIVLSFIAMYIVMYANVDKWDDVHPSLARAYMAALMTMPMVILELLLMGAMYPDRKLNAAIIAAGAVGLAAFWMAIRTEAGVGDVQFLKSMIPHHSGAILMCRESTLTDQEIVELCKSIRQGQQREIDQMHRILARLGKG